MDDELSFIYCDARGTVTARHITSMSKSKNYLQGYCSQANDFRTFRLDRIIEENPQNINAALEHYKNTLPQAKPPPTPRNVIDVCFTGYVKNEKEIMIALAEKAGFVIRKSVTAQLDFLSYSSNAGPKKLEKARKQGVCSIDVEQTKLLFETGEVPTV